MTKLQKLMVMGCMGLCTLTFTSCETLSSVSQGLLQGLPKPEVFFSNLSIANLTESAAELDLTLDVKNPYPVPLFAKSLGFALSSEGQQILESVSNEAINVRANSTDPVNLRVKLPYTQALAALKSIKPGAVIPLTTAVDLSLSGQDVSPLNFNMERTTEVPIPTVPEVEVESVKWDELSLSKAKATMNLSILNTNSFPVDLEKLDYNFVMGKIPVAKGLIDDPISFASGESQTLRIGFELEPSQMGFAAFNMLRSKSLDYNLTGGFDAKTPFGPIEWALDKSDKTALIGK
ncbi:MAG: LEA type 2 family protein [Sumerlaeia bacterium]